MPDVLISYIKNICLIAFSGMLCAGVCSAFPDKKGLEGAVKLCVSLCLMLSILAPAKRIFSEIDYKAFSAENNISIQSEQKNVIYLAKTRLEKDLTKDIFEKFGITTTSLSIDLCETENEFFINHISITLDKKDVSEIEKVKSFLSSLFDVPIFIN